MRSIIQPAQHLQQRKSVTLASLRSFHVLKAKRRKAKSISDKQFPLSVRISLNLARIVIFVVPCRLIFRLIVGSPGRKDFVGQLSFVSLYLAISLI